MSLLLKDKQHEDEIIYGAFTTEVCCSCGYGREIVQRHEYKGRSDSHTSNLAFTSFVFIHADKLTNCRGEILILCRTTARQWVEDVGRVFGVRLRAAHFVIVRHAAPPHLHPRGIKQVSRLDAT